MKELMPILVFIICAAPVIVGVWIFRIEDRSHKELNNFINEIWTSDK